MLRGLLGGTVATSLLLGGGTALTALTVPAAQAAGGWVKPVSGAVISQGFGCTQVSVEPVDTACPGGHWHSGIDLAVARGMAVSAVLPGVARALSSPYGFGLHVTIDHGGGLLTLYGHLGAVDVVNGELVGAGEVIGAVGSTGNSTGPHLHFEVRRDGISEDPRLDVDLP